MRIAVFGIVALLVTSALSANGCNRMAADKAAPAAAAAGAPVARATAAKPQRKTLRRSTEQPGQIEAFDTAPLYAKVAGYVESVSVDIGDRVEKGQVLAVLSVPELDQEVKQKTSLVTQAEAELKQAEAGVTVAQATVASANAELTEAEAAVDRSEANYDRWQSEFHRVSTLASTGAVTRKVEDETRSTFRAADAARKEVAAHIKSVAAKIDQNKALLKRAESDVKAVSARVEVAEADLERLLALQGYTKISAPFDGYVTVRNVQAGHFVQVPGATAGKPLFVISQSDVVRVFIDVPELDAVFVNQGDKADVRIQALSDKVFLGEVTRQAQSLDPATRTLRTEIDLKNPKQELRPGMYANVNVLVDQIVDALVVPVAAVVSTPKGPVCLSVESGKVVRKPVELGLRSGGEVQVVSGLGGSELLIVKNASAFAEGQAVEVDQPAVK